MSFTPSILFLADQFVDRHRDAVHAYPGGAERTDDALIKASPFPIECRSFEVFHEPLLQECDVCVIGNSGTASREQLEMITESGKAVLFEHDLRICYHRGHFHLPKQPLHKHLHWCTCRQRKYQRLFASSLGVIYLTQVQRSMYTRNPFYREPRWSVLGSSVFDADFFAHVERYREDPPAKTIDVAVAYSRYADKGFDRSLAKAFELTAEPFVMQNLSPDDVYTVLEQSSTFIHLPRSFEPAGRMPVEARFLGNTVIGNSHVGVMQEPWWNLDDDAALAHVQGAAARFWQTVEEWSRR